METVKRTSVGIREMLFDELDAIRDGRSSPQRAHAIGKITSQILSSAKIELEYSRYYKDTAGLTNIEPLKLA